MTLEKIVEIVQKAEDANRRWHMLFEEIILPWHEEQSRMCRAGTWLYHTIAAIHSVLYANRNKLMARRLNEAMEAFFQSHHPPEWSI